MRPQPTTVQSVIHYSTDDPDCHRDYCSVEVLIDGEVARSYSDGYHDNGVDRADSFIGALQWVYGNATLNVLPVKRVADYEC